MEQIWKKICIGRNSTALSDLLSALANCSFTSFLDIPILLISTSDTTSLATSDPSSYNRGILFANLKILKELMSPPYAIPHSTTVGRLFITQVRDEYAVSVGFNTLVDNLVCVWMSFSFLFVTIVYSEVIPAVRISSPIGLRWSVFGEWNLVCLHTLTTLISSCSSYLSAVLISTFDFEIISFALPPDSFWNELHNTP